MIGVSSEKKITQLIMKVFSCALLDKNISPTLYDRVIRFQRHNHTLHCIRNKKTERGFIKVCRFGFDRPFTEEFVLRNIQTSIVGRRNLKAKSRLYDLSRKFTKSNINDYVPIFMMLWNGNMDIQFVGNHSTALVTYIIKYILISENALEQNILERALANEGLTKRLQSFAISTLYNRECGVIEAADVCLMNLLYGTDNDTVIKWLNVYMMRNKRVLPIYQI